MRTHRACCGLDAVWFVLDPIRALGSVIAGQSIEICDHAGSVGRRNSPDLFGVNTMVVMSKNNPKSAYVTPSNIWVLHTKLLADRPSGFSNNFQMTLNCGLECGILVKLPTT